jgi:DNA polymerase V
MIFHVDANSFYASCEQLFRPDLYGKPVAVLSNNDGITVSLNQECKNLGFARGDVYFKKKADYAAKGVNVFSSNYTLYADISRRLNLLYNIWSSETEFYSIDESFLYFPEWNNTDYAALGRELRAEVFREIHIPVSVGIAPTKTLAKLCNKLAKYSDGVCSWNDLDHEKTLAAYPAADVWGIGPSKASLLARFNVHTALDIAHFPLAKAKMYLSITGFRTVQELNGVSAIDRNVSECRRNITVSRSFAHSVAVLPELETALAEYTQQAVAKMRAEGTVCRIVSVYLMTVPAYRHEDKEKEYINGADMQLREPSCYLPDILTAAVRLMRSVYRNGYEYRKIMVNLLALEKNTELQRELFEPENTAGREKNNALMAVCDRINARYGRSCLHTGLRNRTYDITSEGTEADWIMSRAFLSPAYTTRLSDLPVIY